MPVSSDREYHVRESSTMSVPDNYRTCPCKKIPWSLSSFTAAEFGEVQSLMSKGKDVRNKRDEAGYTPLHLAAQHNHVVATSLLLRLGADVNGEGEEVQYIGATPLHRAAFAGAIATMGLLLQEQRCNLLARDGSFGDLRTPLHKAAAGGRYLAVQLLVDELRRRHLLKVALEATDSSAQTPLQVAQDIIPREDEEHESIARWDSVAGGVPDWHKCVAILQAAESSSERPPLSEPSKLLVESLPLPPVHLATVDGCLNCRQSADGFCSTSSWQAAFQAALGSAVDRNLKTIKLQEMKHTVCDDDAPSSSPSLQTEKSDSGRSIINRSDEDSVICKKVKADADGAVCSLCDKRTVALYATKQGLLVCKQCRRIVG